MSDQNPEPNEKVYRPRGKMLLDNFLGGFAWSLGTLVGAAIILGALGYVLSKVDLIPLIGSWMAQIIQEVAPKNQIMIPK